MFVYKSEKEIAELSEYQREKYFDQKRDHEAKEAKDAAEKAAKDAVELALKDVDSKIADAKKEAQDEAKAEVEAQLKAKDEEVNAKLEAMEKAWEKSNVLNRSEKIKTMSDYITAKFSTPEGEQMLKDFANGAKSALNTEIEVGKATFLKPTTNGGYVAPEMSGIYGQGHEDMHLRQILRVLPTTSDLIKYLRLTPTEGSELPEITAEGAIKKELDFTPEIVEVAVKKIAGYITVSDESISDLVGFRAFLATELPLAYLDAEDLYILRHTTDGLIANAEAWTPQGNVTATSNAWDILVSAGTQIRKNKRKATAAVVSPDVYQELLINKDDEKAYTYPVVADANGVLRVGTMPVYESAILEGGEFVVGDFVRGAKLWQKEAINVRYSDQHADNFIYNLTTIRVEGRVALEVSLPDAFVYGDMGFVTT